MKQALMFLTLIVFVLGVCIGMVVRSVIHDDAATILASAFGFMLFDLIVSPLAQKAAKKAADES